MMLRLEASNCGPASCRQRVQPIQRRGVSSVLAMMFLVIFSSLTAAMAVVAQGNLRTADSAMHVSRAMSAAETGLVFAARRLESEAKRFVIEKGVVDTGYAIDLWNGTFNEGADGQVEILPPVGYATESPPAGVAEAVRDAHLADAHDLIIDAGDSLLPEIDELGTLRVRPIALTTDENGEPLADGPYFRLQYALNQGSVRVISQGVDGDVTRTIQVDFNIDKRIEYAILSPNRIMIGKNVRIEGPLGSRYGLVAGELEPVNGDPLVMRGDFYYLDDNLDLVLDTFFTQLADFDVDGDGRLRPDHPTESLGLEGFAELTDANEDEYVDDFDLFMNHYDANSDGMVVYDSALAASAGLGALADEFADVDDQLARLIDETYPDRDGDGESTSTDVALGYTDGVIDANDLYAKVHGRLAFAVARDDWEFEHGESYQTIVNGPVRHAIDAAATEFEVSDEDLREITTDMFTDSQTWFDLEAAGDFAAQLAAQDGIGEALFTPPSNDTWEDVPFGSADAGGAPYDFYQRPIVENMIFTNVRIPVGANALFVGCTFVGVTYVETETDCGHENWNYAGAIERVDDGAGGFVYEQKFPNLTALLDGQEIPDTKIVSNSIRFHDCTFLGSLSGEKPDEYTHWRNKIQISGESRFYLDPEDENLAQQPDAEDLEALLEAISDDDRVELAKSSILLPGWSVDVGNFNNDQGATPEDTAKVKLKGTIVAGILDVRGTADVHGTLLMTFRPTAFEGPLFYGGQTDAFNTTIGYFGPADGDGEGVNMGDATFQGFGEIVLRYDPEAKLPDGIPWPIHVDADASTYFEGGSIE